MELKRFFEKRLTNHKCVFRNVFKESENLATMQASDWFGTLLMKVSVAYLIRHFIKKFLILKMYKNIIFDFTNLKILSIVEKKGIWS